MSEERPTYGADQPAGPVLSGWRARLVEEVEKAVKNWNRPFIIVLKFDGSGACQVIPMAPPTARIEVGK